MIDCEDFEKAKESKATVLKGYLEIFTVSGTYHSEVFWNDVVIPCKIEDLHSYSELNYRRSQISKKKNDWMRLLALSEQQWRQMNILLRMKGRCPPL